MSKKEVSEDEQSDKESPAGNPQDTLFFQSEVLNSQVIDQLGGVADQFVFGEGLDVHGFAC